MPEFEPQHKQQIVLSPGQYAMYRDRTNGSIQLFVGAKAHSPSSTEEPVRFIKTEDEVHTGTQGTRQGRSRGYEYVVCTPEEAVQREVIAVQGFYAVLFNPALDGSHPKASSSGTREEELDVGRKINIPGPVSFPLFPGQMAEVIRGHQLRSNEYLVIKINDEDRARENWTDTIVKKVEKVEKVETSGEGTEGEGEEEKRPEVAVTPRFNQAPDDLAVGKRYIIKGTEVSFYIPPTGVSVELNSDGDYVRSALTVERLWYCVLKAESGDKRFERGPAVVFPTPTEVFLANKQGETKFRAIELNEISGVHLKVIADYIDGDDVYEEGVELFITGKQTAIYFPRQEHAILEYDGNQKHYATAIPTGQGRYVLGRMTGGIKVEKGPDMVLLDPRIHVFVRRVLSDEEVMLWYPDNCKRGGEALVYNRNLREMAESTPTTRSAVTEGEIRRSRKKGMSKEVSGAEVNAVSSGEASLDGGQGLTSGMVPSADAFLMSNTAEAFDPGHTVSYSAALVDQETVGRGVSQDSMMDRASYGNQKAPVADKIERESTYSKPRAVTFSNKYDGVPVVKPRTGYAIKIVVDGGGERVVLGPETVLVEYDETLQPLKLSRGVPKTSTNLLATVYLQVKNNRVSDFIEITTRDHVKVGFRLSFLVDFEGDTEEDMKRWFEVENYVRLLTDHVRSLLIGVGKRTKIGDLYDDGVDIVRDAILGQREEDADGESSREGLFFPENGMRVNEVEVLEISIQDETIRRMLAQAQHEAVKHHIDIEKSKGHLEHVQEQQRINRDLSDATATTESHGRQLVIAAIVEDLAVTLKGIETKVQEATQELEVSKAAENAAQFDFEHKQDRMKTVAANKLEIDTAIQELTRQLVVAETQSYVDRFKAISGDFTQAMIGISDKTLLANMAESVNVLRIAGGKNVAEVLGNIFKDTPLQGVLARIMSIPVLEASNNGQGVEA